MTFKEFVKGCMEPLEAMQLPYGMNLDAILRADMNYLIESAGVPPEMQKPHAQAWLNVEGAKRVKAVCAELVTFTDIPLLPTVRAVWGRLYPNRSIAAPDCEYCAGTGWEEREFTLRHGIFAGEKVTAATRCRCGGMPPAVNPEESYQHQR